MHGTWDPFDPPDQKLYQTFPPIFYLETDDPLQSLYLSVPRRWTPKAAILWFHGGGLTADGREVPTRFYEGGNFIVAEARYRLSPEHPAPAPLNDAAAALKWFIDHVAEYGGSPERIFVGGMSAGSYLAAIITMNPAFAEKFAYRTFRAAGLLLISGQMTTHFQVKADLGYPGEQFVPVIDALAPMRYCSKHLPPMLLVTGESPLEMPARTEENAFMAASCRALGHPKCEHYILGGHDHGSCVDSCDHLALRFIDEALAR